MVLVLVLILGLIDLIFLVLLQLLRIIVIFQQLLQVLLLMFHTYLHNNRNILFHHHSIICLNNWLHFIHHHLVMVLLVIWEVFGLLDLILSSHIAMEVSMGLRHLRVQKGHNSYRSNGGFKGNNFRQNGNSSWSGNTDTRTNVVIECQICNKRGHTAANCYHRNNNNVSGNGFQVECQICGKRGHSALECFHRGNYAFQGHPPPPSFNAMSAQQTSSYGPADSWIVDFGAFHHMTANINGLSQVMPFEGSEKITIRNGQSNKEDTVSRKE